MLETDRLKFKPLNSKYEKDLEKLFCKNHLVMKTALKGRVFTKNEFKKILKEDFIKSETDQVGFWCLTSGSEDRLIGITGLLKCNYLNRDNYEFGFILDDNNWGKGLATEIGQFWLDYAKNEMNLTELIATVSPENIRSRKVLEKLKMEYVSEFELSERGNRLIFRKSL
ncbi:GNAT family N-acetyltransferase [Oceanihabitans sp. IOP_32]|uniref:GNAT family N-acetyltransferase n=1 Tax=Oceanihabitans sp. IOP_32 TaxID=2529032 RepID=UPI001293DE9E|nr:GNAT family N-acetyltransferase [Oceanihabitans sp. IOP_32]QFZ53776.1 GNAT family N-acetyltransferase [Oceanihabitans sp. IOP_32]